MTPTELKNSLPKSSYFFGRQTMKFFGDTMKNYGVRAAVILCKYDSQGHDNGGLNKIVVWELYRKRPVNNGLQKSAYFHQVTFVQVQRISIR